MQENFEQLIQTSKKFSFTISFIVYTIFLILFSNLLNENLNFWLFYLISFGLIVIGDTIPFFYSVSNQDLIKLFSAIIYGFRSLGYLLLLFLFIIYPPGFPISFLIPNFLSLDYLVLIFIYVLGGLIFTSIKMVQNLLF